MKPFAALFYSLPELFCLNMSTHIYVNEFIIKLPVCRFIFSFQKPKNNNRFPVKTTSSNPKEEQETKS